MPRGPEGANTTTCVEGEGVCYFVDSEASNSWRSLRILNESEDTTYVEYDSTWSWNESSVEFYELYDLRVDPYQTRNMYENASAARRAALHAEVRAYYACAGGTCP